MAYILLKTLSQKSQGAGYGIGKTVLKKISRIHIS
jgi:hypothetical protein